MQTLEEFVDLTLKNNGIRVSPRRSLNKRLLRVIDLTCKSKKLNVDQKVMETVASLFEMKYSSTRHPMTLRSHLKSTV